MAANFPNSPNTNDTFTSNGVTFTWDGSAWKQSATPGVKGLKGEKGDKGEKGIKGEKGEKGQKGEVGLSGNAGGKGEKGQKGEKGEKGQKGEVGQKGQKGEDNSTKGQKGDDNSTKGEKGQKGQTGADNSTKGQKGQKGEIGPQGTGGSKGDKGQKGEVGTGGTDGSDGDKGQKGDEGFLANSSQTGSYTLVAADDQKLINTNSGVTVPSGVFSASDAVTIVNNSTSTITITQASGVTMYLGGTSTTGNRTLQQKGIATVVCISSNTFIISGAGLY